MSLPDEPVVETTTTKRLTIELDDKQVSEIIQEWAKRHGFSHRAEVEHFADRDFYTGCAITETFNSYG